MAEGISSTATEPSPVPTTVPGCWGEPGILVNNSLPVQGVFSGRLDFSVYLPPCYAEQETDHYPVLYLFHGQGYTNDQWVRLGALRYADALIASGEAMPFMIVLPDDPTFSQPSETTFDEAVVEAVIPYVDAHYRTHPERQYRSLGGLSRGAGWAIHLGLTHPELFGVVGAHSPVILAEDGGMIPAWLEDLTPQEMPYFFLDTGDRDGDLMSAIWFADLLVEHGILSEWRMFLGYHDEAYWSAHVQDYLRWHVQAWQGKLPALP